jgi:hypothetical protein
VEGVDGRRVKGTSDEVRGTSDKVRGTNDEVRGIEKKDCGRVNNSGTLLASIKNDRPVTVHENAVAEHEL